MTVSTVERAAQYLRQVPPALSGSGGHGTTFAAAVALTRGFALDEQTAFRLLSEIHNPTCEPPWSERELRHKVESAAKGSTRAPGYLLERNDRRDWQSPRKAQPSEQLDPTSYHNVIARLLDLCPFVDESDVLAYCERRVLVIEGANVRLGGLPPPHAQRPIVAELLRLFETQTLVRAGLLRCDESGAVDTSRFMWPRHRLLIPWRDPDGRIDILQRRRLDAGDPKYVFPRGRKPPYPFGVEQFAVAPDEHTIVWCEGAVDVLALRLLAFRDRLPIVPLGLPGLDGWRADWAGPCGGRHVRVGFDADSADDKHAERITRDLYAADAASVSRWTPSGAKDWAEAMERGVPRPEVVA
ncbi:MAG: hypothetical protein JW940_29820 [Polyangiaceae bacterium]|nr:hypothetical protein [Polyangiaceae bacterium]